MSMTWNYRILVHTRDKRGERLSEPYYAVHEVYYDAAMTPHSCTLKPVTVGGDSPEDIEKQLSVMLVDIERPPIDFGRMAKASADQPLGSDDEDDNVEFMQAVWGSAIGAIRPHISHPLCMGDIRQERRCPVECPCAGSRRCQGSPVGGDGLPLFAPCLAKEAFFLPQTRDRSLTHAFADGTVNAMADHGSVVEDIISRESASMISRDGWIDMLPVWSHLKGMGSERDEQKRSYASTKNWSRLSTHFLGLVGEAAVSVLTGIPINLMLDPMGDGCRDFTWDGYTIDVKGTLYWREPHLKQYPKPKRWCDIYILVGIDEGMRRAQVSGWATGAEVQTAEMVDYGHGPQRSITHDRMHRGMPPMLPTRKGVTVT